MKTKTSIKEIDFIDYGVYTGEENMSIDSKLLEDAIAGNAQEPVFRLYGWSPACISLGRNQDDKFIDKAFLKNSGIDIVRRLTGGRALLHDKEITYSYISPASLIPNGEKVIDSYKYISGLWLDIFKNMNINLEIGGQTRHITKNNFCMSVSTGADICFEGKKFIGSAQYRKNGYILQHGSILLDYDPNSLNNVFNEQTDYSTIVSLKEINPEISVQDIITATKSYFFY